MSDLRVGWYPFAMPAPALCRLQESAHVPGKSSTRDVLILAWRFGPLSGIEYLDTNGTKWATSATSDSAFRFIRFIVDSEKRRG